MNLQIYEFKILGIWKYNKIIFRQEARNKKMENKITPKIIETVKECLPEQPWPTGINKSIAQKLNLSHREVSNIINILIERGDFLMQINGKLYAEKKDQIS